MKRIASRSQLVQRVRRHLEKRGYPRLQMLLLVALTGGAGFLASFAMLHLGVDILALRYPLAVFIAYGAFLCLLWVWLRARRDELDGTVDFSDVVNAAPDVGERAKHWEGGGGQFGGGGSSGSWDTDQQAEPLVELPEVPLPSVDAVADADEVAIPLAILLFIAGIVLMLLFAAVSIVYSAPVLFAELVVDGVLAATLYRRLRRIDSRHWLESAIRRTIVPFAATAFMLAIGGWALTVHAPDARTIGEAIAAQR